MVVLADTLCHILIVGPYQGIAEIPRMSFKHFVVCLEADGLQILDGENGCGAGVALAEGVNLPNTRNEARQMQYDFVHSQAFVAEVFFLVYVIIQSHSQVLPSTVEHGVATQHPFLLGDVIVAQLAGMLKHSFEDTPMDGD